VPGCTHAGISLIDRRGRISTVAATGGVVRRIDALQYRAGVGPCLDAIADHIVCTIDDLARESRWPGFCRPAAEATGIASMLSFRLFTMGDALGALNLYSDEAGAFTTSSRAVGTILAAHAAIAIVAADQHRDAENLEIALHTSRRIGIAVGVLMATRNLDEDQAFALLVTTSQRVNRKVRDLAEAIIDGRGLPGRQTSAERLPGSR